MIPPLSGRSATLVLSRVVVLTRLGWGDAERGSPQSVSLDIELRFGEPPAACHSDRLADTVDYALLVARLVAVTREEEFRLLEHLTQRLHETVRSLVPRDVRIAITATKQPPLPEVTGGASFRLGDWPAEAR